jgi:hypothetical protein
MPVVVMPIQTAERLKQRLLELAKDVDVRMFLANQRVVDLQFTPAEIVKFGGETGPATVVAVAEMAQLSSAIAEEENGKLNYIAVVNKRALTKLDPFVQ